LAGDPAEDHLAAALGGYPMDSDGVSLCINLVGRDGFKYSISSSAQSFVEQANA
jgi:hypothetical protein